MRARPRFLPRAVAALVNAWEVLHRAGGVNRRDAARAALAVLLTHALVWPLAILVAALLAGCGSVDTPRELYDAPPACRALAGCTP